MSFNIRNQLQNLTAYVNSIAPNGAATITDSVINATVSMSAPTVTATTGNITNLNARTITGTQTFNITSGTGLSVDGAGVIGLLLTTNDASKFTLGQTVSLAGNSNGYFNGIKPVITLVYPPNILNLTNPTGIPNGQFGGGGTVSGGSISTIDLNATNLNGKLNVVGQATATSGNIVYCSNTTNTTGNYDLLTDSGQHFTFSGGTGAGSNVLTVGGGTYGGITVPSTSGEIKTNKLSSNATTALTLNSNNTGSLGEIALQKGGTTYANLQLANASFYQLMSETGFSLDTKNNGSINIAANGTGNVNLLTGAVNRLNASSSGITIYDNTGGIKYRLTNSNQSTMAMGDAVPGYQDNQLNIGKDQNLGGYNGALTLGFVGSNALTGSACGAVLCSISPGNCWQPMRFYAGFGNASPTNDYCFNWYATSVRIQTMNANGTFNASDKRLKNNINPIETALDKILQLKPSTFSYNIDVNNKLVSGFIAQDIQPIFSHMIDEITIHQDDDTKYMFFNQAQLIPYLTKAIQEQNETINAQQATIQSLKEDILTLHASLSQLITQFNSTISTPTPKLTSTTAKSQVEPVVAP